jgi:hypothetical protein
MLGDDKGENCLWGAHGNGDFGFPFSSSIVEKKKGVDELRGWGEKGRRPSEEKLRCDVLSRTLRLISPTWGRWQSRLPATAVTTREAECCT